MLKDSTLRLDKLTNDSIDDNDLVLGFIQKRIIKIIGILLK